MFIVMDNAGNEVSGQWRSKEAAVADAREMLEDDPERGELTVWELDEHEAFAYHVRTIAFGPDRDWQSVVVDLAPGERVTAPGPIPAEFHCDPDESAGYALDDPKHPTFYERYAAAWDEREGK